MACMHSPLPSAGHGHALERATHLSACTNSDGSESQPPAWLVRPQTTSPVPPGSATAAEQDSGRCQTEAGQTCMDNQDGCSVEADASCQGPHPAPSGIPRLPCRVGGIWIPADEGRVLFGVFFFPSQLGVPSSFSQKGRPGGRRGEGPRTSLTPGVGPWRRGGHPLRKRWTPLPIPSCASPVPSS